MFTSAARTLAASMTTLLFLSMSDPGLAQPVFQLTPVVDVVEAYDSNLLFAPHDGDGDFQTRVSPGIGSRYQSSLAELEVRYAIDADRFAAHPALSGINGQKGAVDLRYRPTARVSIAAETTFVETHTPGEFNIESGLSVGRAEARRLLARSTLARELNANDLASIEYSFVADQLAGGVRSQAHHAGFALARQRSARTSTMFRYDLSLFAFAPQAEVTTHVLTAGWMRAVTRGTSISLRGGPRIAATGVTPEYTAAIQLKRPSLRTSLEVTRTQTTVIGVGGLADTSALALPVHWTPRARIDVAVTPGAARVAYQGVSNLVYRLSIEASRVMSNGTSLLATYEANFQQANGYRTGTPPPGSITRHVVSVGVRRTPTRHQETQ
jgi:hypothetical protein